MQQHRGASAEPLVGVGDRVLKRQLVARPGPAPSAAVHAPTSGIVRAIERRPVPLGNAIHESTCIVIETDGEDRADDTTTVPDWSADKARQIELIRNGGLAGLGGAVFPTADKLAVQTTCRTLIVNGAECEPYISCDDLLMREAPREIVEGAILLADLLSAERCVIAIERDKPKALEAIGAAARAAGDPRVRLAELPTVYPAGGERQLIEVVTGEEVPSGRFPNDIGHICHNVGTAYALQRLARAGEPLISRIVTVTGRGIREPQNVEVLLGTPIADVVAFAGGYTDDVARLIVGGSMMGYAVPSDELPITKASNCIIAAAREEVRIDEPVWACIRCGECASVCPARLQPQELHRAANHRDHVMLSQFGLNDCIECGCCDVACPSHLPLTEQFRAAKRSLAHYEQQLTLSDESAERFEKRRRRQEADAAAERAHREGLISQVKSARADKSAAIEAAVERARKRRSGSDAEAE